MARKKPSDKLTIPELPFSEVPNRLDGADADGQAVGSPTNGRPQIGKMIEDLMMAFEDAAHKDNDGAEFWLARELSPLLGYKDYRNFLNAVDKARATCLEIGEDVADHFGDVTKMMPLGKGAERAGEDVELTRFACYLIAQNGDPQKRPEIAAAQTYFAIQTRRQEIADQVSSHLTDDQRRVLLRDKLKEHNRLLAEAAQLAGVTNFRNFNGAGLKGLYGGLSKVQVVRRKQLPPRTDHLDHAGHEELAANYFKATQAEAKLRREAEQNGEMGQRAAETVHKKVGEDIHDFIVAQGNTPPEDLKAEDHIRHARKRIKGSSAAGSLPPKGKAAG